MACVYQSTDLYVQNYTAYLPNSTVSLYEITRFVCNKVQGFYLPNYIVCIYKTTQFVSTKLHGFKPKRNIIRVNKLMEPQL
jgi:hypothetical protein